MNEFLSLLDEATALAQRSIDAPDNQQYRQAALEAIERMREAYRHLSAKEQRSALPLAQRVSAMMGIKKKARGPMLVFEPLGGGDEADLVDLYRLEALPLRTYPRDGARSAEAIAAWMGYDHFRSGQREAVDAALAQRDSLVIMPTGGGKSLCYQAPGIASEDLTIVVSPLIALMQDQYRRLRADGHPAVMLASGLGEDWNRQALDRVADGRARIVFASPERFATNGFRTALSARKIALFVVDEAHCLSEWGHDFRPDFLRLQAAIEMVGRPPVMACTATATPKVAAEIAGRLCLSDPVIVNGGFDRPNLSWDVIPLGGTGSMERKFALLVRGLLMKENLPAIVYCGRRKDVDEIADRLREHGLSAVAYHAGLGPEARRRAQAQFMSGEAHVVVATNAFGMGVDKADVRSVWHWALTTSVESYYQEAGRAGRDGQSARAVLLAMRADLGRLIRFNKDRALDADAVLKYFEQLQLSARKSGSNRVRIDPPEDDKERLALAVAERVGACLVEPVAGGRLEIEIIEALNLRNTEALCRAAEERNWEAFRAIERFAATDDVCRRQQILDHFGDQRKPAPLGRCCDVCDPPDWLPDPETATVPALPAGARTRAHHKGKKKKAAGAVGEDAVFEMLREWRRERADGKPAYTICNDAALREIARSRPSDQQALLAIKGIGPAFIRRHGQALLQILKP